MPRKSVDYNVQFFYPTTEEGKKILAEAIGKVHIKSMKEILDKKFVDVSMKNRVITEVQKELVKNSKGRGKSNEAK